MEKSKNYVQFTKTYSFKSLMEKHSMLEDGEWEVYGEDQNCDFGGHHHEPLLEVVSGKLEDVIEYAVELAGFWAWGGGGKIVKRAGAIKVISPRAMKIANAEKRISALQNELTSAIEELEFLQRG